jgi:hypothetical protein
MGALIKLIAFILIIYFLMKFAKYILKSLFYMVVDKPQEKVHQERKRPKDGNVDIDYVPNNHNKSKTSHSGDYVDYEEIK